MASRLLYTFALLSFGTSVAAADADVSDAEAQSVEACTCLVGLLPATNESIAPEAESFSAALARASFDPEVGAVTFGDAALSLPVDAITSFVPDAVPTTPERVLWCEDSDDPRCSQDAGQPDASELAFPGPAMGSSETQDDPRLGAVTDGQRAHLGGAAGVLRTLDRPPRG